MKPVVLAVSLSALLAFHTSSHAQSPNATDYFQDAAELLKSDSIDSTPKDLNVKREAIKKNDAALRRFRQGLAYEYSHTTTAFDQADFAYAAKMRALARLLVAEGEVHLADGQTSDAVNSFVDAVRLGQEIPRGEPLLGALVGFAIEAIGRHHMWEVVSKLDAPTAQRASWRLQLLNARRHPYTETLRAEQQFSLGRLEETTRKASPEERAKLLADYKTMMEQEIANAATPYVYKAVDAASEKLLDNMDGADPTASVAKITQAALHGTHFQDAKTRVLSNLLATTLALHAWKLEKGVYPEKLAELAPRYLETMPRDSFGDGTPLRYKKTEDSYVLYAVGPDGRDDSGRAIAVDANLTSVQPASDGDIVAGVNLR